MPGAANPAAAPAAWQIANSATLALPGASGLVSTPRLPGAIETYHGAGAEVPAGGWPTGASPATPQAGSPLPGAIAPIADVAPGAQDPISAMNEGLPGRGPAPSLIPTHDGAAGPQIEPAGKLAAQIEIADGSDSWFYRVARGNLSIGYWWNQIARRIPTDWQKVYGPEGQLTSYDIPRPSLDIKPWSDRDTVPHYVEYEQSPIYLKVAQVAKVQGTPAPYGYRTPYGHEPDANMGGIYAANEGNPVYTEPPDPQVIPTNAVPVSYGLSDLYG